jgi:hypothetical protein
MLSRHGWPAAVYVFACDDREAGDFARTILYESTLVGECIRWTRTVY